MTSERKYLLRYIAGTFIDLILTAAVAALFLCFMSAAMGAEPEIASAPVEASASGGVAPETVGVIVASVVASLAGGYKIGQKTMKIEPSPLKVKAADTYVTRAEFVKLEKRHEAFENDIRNLLRESETRSHGRMDEISEKLSEVIGMLKVISPSTAPAPSSSRKS